MADHLVTSVNVLCGNGRCQRSFTSTLTHTRHVCPYCLFAAPTNVMSELVENAALAGGYGRLQRHPQESG